MSATVLVCLLIVTWHNRADVIAPWFAATLVAFLLWTVGYLFEIAAATLGVKLFWADVQFVGIAVLPVVWLEVVYRYTGRGAVPRIAATLLWMFVAVSLVVVVADPGGIFRHAPVLDATVTPSIIVPHYGWYWALVFMPLNYLIVAVSVVLLLVSMWRERRSPYRRQYALLAVATALPLLAGTIYVLGAEPAPGLNPATAVASVSGAIMAYALFRYRLFDLAPLARGAVVEHLSDGVVVLDCYDRIVDYNRAAAHLFPGLEPSALGRPVSEILAIHPGLLDSIGQAASGEQGPSTVVAELSMTVPSEEGDDPEASDSRHFTLALTSVRGRSGRLLGHSLLLHDVTRSVELLRQVERLTTTDPLTELLTRAAFLELGEREMIRARRQGFAVWLMRLDLDGFSRINDLYGGDAGDEAMRAVAHACRRILRAFDLVGRFGGAEFAMLLPYLKRSEAEELAERLRQTVEGLPVFKEGRAVHLTASIGVAGTEHVDGEYLTDLLTATEVALEEARDAGPNHVVCRSSD